VLFFVSDAKSDSKEDAELFLCAVISLFWVAFLIQSLDRLQHRSQKVATIRK